jgi:WD40 repeat protein
LLIKWDIAKRRAIDKRQLESAIMSVDLNLKTNTIAVGFRNGAVTFLDCTSMKSMGKINNHKNPDKEVLSLVKYSPNG